MLIPVLCKTPKLIVGLVLVSLACSALADIKVVASIKPLALIAQEVVGDQGVVEILLPTAASPHDYPLKVSDIRRLQEADLVLWIGPELEAFLQRPLGNIPVQKQISSFQLAGLHWPKEQHVQNNDDHHHGRDPHLWLDPQNAIVIARALAAKLVKINPEAETFYLANTERFVRDTEALNKQLSELLTPVSSRGFAVYHEGYQHFVTRFRLHQLGYVTFSPEQRPGAKHLYQLRNQLKGNAVCLFAEPYYDRRKASELADDLGLLLGVLDPIGNENTQSYKELLDSMANALLACLSQT